MRLKGKMLDRLPPEKRERMERTLKRMEDVRRNDDMRLRNVVNAKKDWADKERDHGYEVIDALDKQIESIKQKQEDVKKQILKLDGILLVLNELIVESDRMAEQERKDIEEARRIAEEEQAKKEAEKKKSKPRVTRKKAVKKITKKK
jgi:hypothetical protein